MKHTFKRILALTLLVVLLLPMFASCNTEPADTTTMGDTTTSTTTTGTPSGPTVKLELDGGTRNSFSNNINGNYRVQQKVTLPNGNAIKRYGYKLEGWSLSSDAATATGSTSRTNADTISSNTTVASSP